MNPSTPTIPPNLSGFTFAQRLAANFPNGWSAQDALINGGVIYAILLAVGNELSFELGTPNTQAITVGGTAIVGATITLTLTGNNLPAPVELTVTVQAGEALSDVANSIVWAIGSTAALSPVNIIACAADDIAYVHYPSVSSSEVWTTEPPAANTLNIVASSSDPRMTVAVSTAPTAQTGSLQFAAAATRLQTAIGNALDLASADLTYPTVTRNPGESDTDYRIGVLAALLPSGAIRQAISDAVERVTGVVPRIVEPWRPSDTGTYDGVWVGSQLLGAAYYGVDTVETPGRYTDANRYQGFVDSIVPGVIPLGGNPLRTYDDFAYYTIPGAYGGYYLDLPGTSVIGETDVYSAINAAKVLGTVVWVRFVSSVS
jgi:hypothetical protein